MTCCETHFSICLAIGFPVGAAVCLSIRISSPIRFAIAHAVHLHSNRIVFRFVEIAEKEQEHHPMEANPCHEVFRVVAFTEQQLELMDEDGNELHHLECCQILLPPNEFLVFWSHGGDHVVEIHDNVNERIQHSEKRAVPA